MKLLITGGAGYLGSTLTRLLLEAGHSVRVLDVLLHGGQSLLGIWSHPRFEFVRGDIQDDGVLRSSLEGIDGVVHLAAIVGDPACARQPDVARRVNLEASRTLIRLCHEAKTQRLIFASTCSNYGRMTDPTKYVDEGSELHPVSLYAETKVAVERELLSPSRDKSPLTTVLRFATIYGVSPRMRFDLTVNEFTMEMLTKRHLVVFGEQFWRPYVHVRDAARAIHRTLEASPDQVAARVFNVGATDQNFTKMHLVEMIRPLASDAVVEFVHRDEDPRDYRVSFETISKVLGYSVSRTVKEGIHEVARLVQGGVLSDFTDSRYRN